MATLLALLPILLGSAGGIGLGLAEPAANAVLVKSLPTVLKAARLGVRHMHATQRPATEAEIRAIERSGAARATMGGWFR